MPTIGATAAITAIFLLASASLAHWAGAEPAMPPAPPSGESYVCYPVDKEIQPIQVTLNDQFGPHFFTAYRISRFCTPASRRADWADPRPVPSADLHYACYFIRPSRPFAMTATVVINNEFSNDKLEVKLPTEVCLPSTSKRT